MAIGLGDAKAHGNIEMPNFPLVEIEASPSGQNHRLQVLVANDLSTGKYKGEAMFTPRCVSYILFDIHHQI